MLDSRLQLVLDELVLLQREVSYMLAESSLRTPASLKALAAVFSAER